MPAILNSVSNIWKYSVAKGFTYILQANLAVDISNSNLNNGALAQFSDITGTGTWRIFEGTTSIANISNSTAFNAEGAGTQMVQYKPNISDYFWRYTFDTGTYSGTNIYDVFGGNQAIMNGDVSINTIAANQPLSFGDGYLNMNNAAAPTNYVQLPGTFRPDMTAGTTFSLWVYVGSGTADYSYAFSFGRDPSGLTGVVRFGKVTPNINLAVYDSAGILTGSNKFAAATLTTNAWMHYTWVLTPSRNWYLYTNGALTDTFTNVNYLTDQSYNNCYFGRTNFSGTPSFLGRLDDFQMFKRALSADEAFLIYKATRHQINYPFETVDVIGSTVANNAITKIYDGTLMSGASVPLPDAGSRIPGKSYLKLVKASDNYFKFKPFSIGNTGFSFSLWLQATTNNTNGSARVFDIRDGGFVEISITIMSTTGIRFNVNGTAYNYTGLTNLVNSSNIWNHLAMSVTWLSSTTATYAFYYNGVYINQNILTNGYPSTGVRTAYNIGGYSNASNIPNERLDGGIDDFRWFAYPISAFEVSQLYNDTFDINRPFNKIANVSGNSIPVFSTIPGINTLFPTQTGYTVKANEITISPGDKNTYCVWTSPKTATYALDVSFADFGLRTDGVGFQIFTVNAIGTFKQQLFARTVTPNALTNTTGSYLTIPRYLVSLQVGDQIYLRADLGVTNTTNDGSVISAFIYEQTVAP